MKKKDYIIITFFGLIFLIVLYQRKIAPMMRININGTGSASGNGTESSQFSNQFGSANGKNAKDPGKESKNYLDGIFSQFEDSVGKMDINEDPNKEIKPPSGMNRTSYYVNGKFKSSYDGEKVPDEFLTKKEYFTDPRKMKQDIEFKMDKMLWDTTNEKKEFERTHDVRGKDKEAYIKLLDDHRRMKRMMMEQNDKTWAELKKEVYESDSELR